MSSIGYTFNHPANNDDQTAAEVLTTSVIVIDGTSYPAGTPLQDITAALGLNDNQNSAEVPLGASVTIGGTTYPADTTSVQQVLEALVVASEEKVTYTAGSSATPTFPTNPKAGDEFSNDVYSWIFDGTTWVQRPFTTAENGVRVDANGSVQLGGTTGNATEIGLAKLLHDTEIDNNGFDTANTGLGKYLFGTNTPDATGRKLQVVDGISIKGDGVFGDSYYFSFNENNFGIARAKKIGELLDYTSSDYNFLYITMYTNFGELKYAIDNNGFLHKIWSLSSLVNFSSLGLGLICARNIANNGIDLYLFKSSFIYTILSAKINLTKGVSFIGKFDQPLVDVSTIQNITYDGRIIDNNGLKIKGNNLNGVGIEPTEAWHVNGNVRANNVYATSFIITSDEKTKKQIESVSANKAVETILSLPDPVLYTYLEPYTDDQTRQHVNFLAQDIEKLLPHAVTKRVYPKFDENGEIKVSIEKSEFVEVEFSPSKEAKADPKFHNQEAKEHEQQSKERREKFEQDKAKRLEDYEKQKQEQDKLYELHNDTLQLDANALTPYLAVALRSTIERVQALETQNAVLQKEVTAIKDTLKRNKIK